MSSTLTVPQVSAAITGNLAGGTAPARTSSNVNDATASTPTVGTSAGNANALYSGAITVASGTPQTIDLTSVTDPLGASVVFTSIRAIKITNTSTTAGQNVTFGGGTNEVFSGASETLEPGGTFLFDFPAGKAVDGTHKAIILTAAAGSPVIDVTVLGHTA
jgi:hypothetical protein